MIVETERLLLRPFVAADIPAYRAIRAKPEVVRWLAGGEAGAARSGEVAERVVNLFAAQWRATEPGSGYGPWAVIEKCSERLIGHLGLRQLPEMNDETEILYLLDSDCWGKGYATEGALRARDFGLCELQLGYLVAFAVPDNAASVRVMERIGMRYQGMATAFGLDVVRYQIAREEVC